MAETAAVAPVERHTADVEVGRHVHMLMWSRQIKQAELATRLGIQQSALSKKLRGHRPWSVDELLITAGFLNTTVAYLVGEIDDEKCTPRDLNPEPTDSGLGGPVDRGRVRAVVSLAAARERRYERARSVA